ncbi:SusC/RagA family TonB-linked outer membrane protein [Pontibacter sp. HSC-36F09]|uniref:SusC/RagA family TonB-linked outer membrane protein n=1 Tax=Pontibacter sp. HSC-36F09 TaxID=2910966 RepID=UPI00209E3F37|nr:SusC/RagA family TonB-linked outer membrane protein [Pontibacter sp. HSC-36F09]MCP2044721.1 TonB-linked SusC/RagA family outer membrane protein [Pontibacter sp. HSC-36F09]
MGKKLLSIILPLMVLWSASAFAQDRAVSGRVTEASTGNGLPGVSVAVKGTTIGIATDAQGNYQLRVPEANATLVFRFLGYTTQEVAVGNQSTINVSLQTDARQLDEVVVTALGIERSERSLGYATQQVQGENLTLTKEQNVLGSLSGKVAGVQVTGSSGASMGGTQKIKIRGVNSLNGGDQPLIVVDGTPISNANFAGADQADYGNLAQDINPEDIESINVLKGPAASALYGIRGQYGVIMITTKKGQKGAKKVGVQINSAFSVEKAVNFMPLQNMYGGGSSQTWRTLPNGDKYVDFSVDESWGPKMDGTPVRQVYSFYPQDPEYGQLTPFVPHPDNIQDYYETGYNLNNGVTVTGGNENSTFRLSVNDTRVEGVEPNTFLNRNNVGLSGSLDLSKKMTVSTNINYARNNAQRPSQGSEYGARYMVQWFQRNVDMKRMKNYKYDDGTFLNWNLRRPSTATGEVTNFNALYWNNPYFEAYENISNDNRERVFGDVGLTYQILPSLKVSGFVRNDSYTQNIETRQAFGGRRVPAFTTGKYQGRDTNYELLAQYNKEFGDFSLNVNAGGNIFDTRYTYLSMASVGGLATPGFYHIDGSIDRPSTNQYLRRKQIRSMFGMASVGYKDTYFIDASLRNDISSALPPDNNSYWYPSVSGSVVFSELIDWSPLSFGKIRASYAQAGSDLGPYEISPFYSVGTVYAGATSVNTLSVPDNLNNPFVEPSFAHSYEAGLDVRFLNGRLGLDLTLYQQKNRNQILRLPVSGTSGYSSTTINAGLIENKGIEVALSGTPVQSSNFTWNSIFNAGRNRNMVVELHPEIDVLTHYSTTYSSVTSYLNSYEGQPYGSLIGQAYQRDPATGQKLIGSNGMPLYTDATHNFGTVQPDATGGWQNIFKIWKFDLSAMIDYQFGGQFFSRSKMLAVRTGQDPLTVATNDRGANVRDPLEAGGGVKVEGIYAPGTTVGGVDVSGQPASNYVSAQSYYNTIVGRRVYEEWLYDASYIKLRELRLGYTIDKSMLGRLPFQTVSVALISRNVAQLWQKAPEGIDPSEISTGSQSISWYESGMTNSVRSYGINLNITL